MESNKHLILSAVFNLKKDDPKNIQEKMDFHVNYRKQNHPPMTDPSRWEAPLETLNRAFMWGSCLKS
ncbi:MAG: hypothetical protein MZU95_04185 [Desulfomicrobium escambiense]|nr:hypothetical protein [Desulfomicrobium escambiense]